MKLLKFTWLAVTLLISSGVASGQVIAEKKSKVTGPRGNSIERDVKVERRPDGSIERSLDIKRPGGELHRQAIVPGRAPQPQPQGFDGYRGGGPIYVERDVIIERPAPFVPVVPFFNFAFGSPAPPPVFIYNEPVYVAPPPNVMYNPPVRYQQEPQTVVVDPVVDAMGRLRSHHDNSRREGVITLGKLGDSRAVPALIDRLRHDGEKEVRQACCWALLQIGDPQALPWLEQAAIHDKKKEVREGAQKAIALFPRPASTPDQADYTDLNTASRVARPIPPIAAPPTSLPALPNQPEPVLSGPRLED